MKRQNIIGSGLIREDEETKGKKNELELTLGLKERVGKSGQRPSGGTKRKGQ